MSGDPEKYPLQETVCIESGMLEVVCARLDRPGGFVEDAYGLLSTEERDRAARFVFDRDRGRYIAGRAILRRLLARRLGIGPARVPIGYGKEGKPQLDGEFSEAGLQFNLSHSDDVIVFAFANGTNVGVDVEGLRPMDDGDAIAARYFSQRENQMYLALDPADKVAGFFNCWTRKEAFVKALGNGLGFPLQTFDVSLAPGEPARILRVEDRPGDACGWQLLAFSPCPDYVAAVVIEAA